MATLFYDQFTDITSPHAFSVGDRVSLFLTELRQSVSRSVAPHPDAALRWLRWFSCYRSAVSTDQVVSGRSVRVIGHVQPRPSRSVCWDAGVCWWDRMCTTMRDTSACFDWRMAEAPSRPEPPGPTHRSLKKSITRKQEAIPLATFPLSRLRKCWSGWEFSAAVYLHIFIRQL